MPDQILYGAWDVLLGKTEKRCETPFHFFIGFDSEEFPDGHKPMVRKELLETFCANGGIFQRTEFIRVCQLSVKKSLRKFQSFSQETFSWTNEFVSAPKNEKFLRSVNLEKVYQFIGGPGVGESAARSFKGLKSARSEIQDCCGKGWRGSLYQGTLLKPESGKIRRLGSSRFNVCTGREDASDRTSCDSTTIVLFLCSDNDRPVLSCKNCGELLKRDFWNSREIAVLAFWSIALFECELNAENFHGLFYICLTLLCFFVQYIIQFEELAHKHKKTGLVAINVFVFFPFTDVFGVHCHLLL